MNTKSEARWLIIISIVALVVFANSLLGEFVYDDTRQIVRNPLIQDNSLIGKALTSDVWAFKADGNITASNYWRPTFTAWQILNFRVFGLNPFGWHFLNILLHIGVCLLGFLLLRRWNLPPILAFAISLIFAVHPVHVESVAWISGSPDLLFAICLFASFWFAENYSEKDKPLDLILSLVFYTLALGSKEVALLVFPVYLLIFTRTSGETIFSKSKIFRVLPFAAIAIIYFFLRWAVLGEISHPAEESVSFGTALLSVPVVFVFYLKQIIFPLTISANYPLRSTLQIDFFNFILPLIISIAVVAGFYFLAMRSFIQKIGLALFILPLLPVFNITAFLPEQIVHDRYLYLPLFGFLLIIFPFVKEIFEKYFKEKAENILLIFAVLISVLLSFQTFIANLMWADEVSLWSQTSKIDKNSAFTWSQYGVALSDKGKTTEAIEAFNNSLKIKSTPNALLGRAQNYIKTKQFDEAIKDLKPLVELKEESINSYTLYQAYESLAAALQGKQDFTTAENYLRQSREILPIYRASLTEKLAVILYVQNRKSEALQELESVKTQAKTELLPTSKTVFLRLGMLYAEIGDKENAKSNLQEFINLTESMSDKLTQTNRQQASELLKKLQ